MSRAFSAWCYNLIRIPGALPQAKNEIAPLAAQYATQRARRPLQRFLVRGSLGEGGNALTLQPRSPIREIRVIRSSLPLCPFVSIRG